MEQEFDVDKDLMGAEAAVSTGGRAAKFAQLSKDLKAKSVRLTREDLIGQLVALADRDESSFIVKRRCSILRRLAKLDGYALVPEGQVR
jgi:hypothetical protein